MLHAAPAAWYSSAFRLSDGTREVGQLKLATLSERATFSVKDVTFELYREGLMGDFVLDFQDAVLARAGKTSALAHRFVLEVDGQALVLEKDSAFKRAFVLRAGDTGEVVGRMAPPKWYSRVTEIDLPEAIPLPVQVFCFWLVLLMWNRAAAASS